MFCEMIEYVRVLKLTKLFNNYYLLKTYIKAISFV